MIMRWTSALLGALAFLAAHLLGRAVWPWLDGGRCEPAWFLNAAGGVALTAALLFLAAALRTGAAAVDRRRALQRGIDVAIGAAGAMVAVLFAIGPGTLFPLAIAIGALVIAGSAVAGALAGWGCRALAGSIG